MRGKRRGDLFVGMSLCVITFGLAVPAAAGEKPVVGVRLRSRTLAFPVDQREALGVLAEIPEGARRTVFLQLDRILDTGERAALKASGIRLMEYLGDRAWFASVEGGIRMSSATRHGVIAAWMIRPEDRLPTTLVQGVAPDHAVAADGRLLLAVLAFGHTELNVLAEEIRRLGGTVDSISDPFDMIFVRVPPEALSQLAELDGIHWIEPLAPPPRSEMNRARSFVSQTNLPSAPYSLTGSGVEVSMHEFYHAFQHRDYFSRWVQGDAAAGQPLDVGLFATPPDRHASMTAGTIAGDGTRNANFAGMASAAAIVTYAYQSNPCCQANEYADIALALTRGVEVANNSWGHSGCNRATGGVPYGDYTILAMVYDRQVLGMKYHGSRFGNPTVVVFSAGNERAGWWDSSTSTTQFDCITNTSAPYANYGTINQPKPAKNIIVVGAVDSGVVEGAVGSDNDRMTTYSGWGPTSDGRLRPDIVAAGQHGGTYDAGVSSLTNCFGDSPEDPEDSSKQCYRTTDHNLTDFGGYAWYSQTSAAASMTSGCAALLIEDFRREAAGRDPLPSTVKAHFIHTARDLDDSTSWYNLGPDYASGHGLLNIQAAVDQLRSGGWLENCVYHANTDTMSMYIPPRTTSVKVTLVWDDMPASPATTAPALVNDLDLVVTDAIGMRRYPWTLNPDFPSLNARRTAEDHLNNVEVVLADGSVPNGSWTVDVVGTAVPSGPQCYSLVWSPVAEPPGECIPPDCNDGNPCTDDACVDDTCAHTTIPGCCTEDTQCPPDEDCRDSFCELVTNTCQVSDTSPDCNMNGVPDECDISAGTSQDCDGNDTPDECDIVGRNLLENAGAETGDVSGWTPSPSFTVRADNPAPYNGSFYFFAGAVAQASIDQTVDLIAEGFTAADLDSGAWTVSVGGYQRSWPQSPADEGQITVDYLDGAQSVLESFVGPVKTNTGSWDLVGDVRTLRIGTRFVRFTFTSTRRGGTNNDGYLDSAHVILTDQTAPSQDCNSNGVLDECESEATSPLTWWSSRTDSNNVYEVGSERVRLSNATTGYIEGTVELGSFGWHRISFFAQTDESALADPNDYVDIFLNGEYTGRYFNQPVSTLHPIDTVVAGDSVSYHFEFVSSNSTADRHIYVRSGEAVAADCDADGVLDECEVISCLPEDPLCQDCNTNLALDECDISTSTSLDCNATEVPDECEVIDGGDFDGDGVIGLHDWVGFVECMAGPGTPPAPTNVACIAACLNAFDADNNAAVDLKEAAMFQRALTPPKDPSVSHCTSATEMSP